MRLIAWVLISILLGIACYRRYKKGRIMGVVITILSIIAAVYIGMGLLLYFTQARSLYQPTRDVVYTPADIGLEYEGITLNTPDGQRLSAWYIPAEDAKQTVLFCHGNAGNISHRLDTLRMFNELGLNCLIVDYRGYGQSTGRPTEKGTLIDILTGFEWLTEEKGIKSQQIILFGRSLGGSIAAIIAKDVDPGSVVLESAFTSFDDIGFHFYPWLPVHLFSRFNYNTLEAVKQVNSPVLVIHSPEDEMVPFKFGEQIFDAANEPKQFAELKGGHNEGFYNYNGLYKNIWQNWLESLKSSE